MSTTSKHTPGPWLVLEPYTKTNRFPIGYKRNDNAIAILGEANGQGGTEDHNMANAKLIAAAPEMFEALKVICLAVSDCLPIQGEGPIDILYYKAKLLAIDQAAAVCSQVLTKLEKE